MNLCAGNRKHNHDEICFEGRDCPVCSAFEEVDEAEERADKAEAAADALVDKLTDLEREIEELKREPVLTDIKAANGMFKDK